MNQISSKSVQLCGREVKNETKIVHLNCKYKSWRPCLDKIETSYPGGSLNQI